MLFPRDQGKHWRCIWKCWCPSKLYRWDGFHRTLFEWAVCWRVSYSQAYRAKRRSRQDPRLVQKPD